MASKKQNDIGLPVQGQGNLSSAVFLPRFFRSEANLKFLQATVDQLTQPGLAEKLSGFVGRKIAKGYRGNDVYIGDISKSREDYQFEPALVIKDDLDNVTFYKDYNDYINTLDFFDVDTSNHDKINQQESYPWNPNIDWDKFVNFREYYWMPDGPLSVPVRGQSREIQSTFTVTLEEADGDVAYVFNGKPGNNPSLTLYRGQTYRFEIDTPGHPFAIALTRSFTPGTAVIVAGTEGIRQDGQFDAALYGASYDTGDWLVLPDSGSITFGDDENISTLYPDGIRKLGEEGEEIANVYIEKGVIEFTVPVNSPDKLFYISKTTIDTSGLFKIYDIEENSFIDVEEEVVGKKYYTSSNGVEFTNGLKIFFRGLTSPETYQEGEYYVEGVGHAIQLIPRDDLVITQKYSNDVNQAFDDQPFGEQPFGTASSYPTAKDYLTVSRASRDKNAWTRSNRWFHKNVIQKSFEYNGIAESVDDKQKAKRPIIEFEPGLKLWKYGTASKASVDLVDTFTKDVFSTIEGSVGYNIDGIDLQQGMRVLFTADTDALVNGAIYEVRFVNVNNADRITFVETLDTRPLENENVLVKQGNENAGRIYYYDGERWRVAQEKLEVNQAPLFDLCCPEGNFYSDLDVFNSTTFTGCKVFSYKQGTGTVDPELGFPLSYRNINNSGDILFDFNLLTDSFNIQNVDSQITVKTDTAFLRSYKNRTEFEYRNGWSTTPVITRQKVLRQYEATASRTNNFRIDMYKLAGDLNDLKVAVFVNGTLLQENVDYAIDRGDGNAFVRFFTDRQIGDIILFKTLSDAPKNNNGVYELPYNLERNPLNQDIVDFTLGEVIDHVDSMIEDIRGFEGTFPGPSNLRDLGDLDTYGKRFLKHAGPLNLPLYGITSKKYNFVKAIEYSKDEYSKFKRNFIKTASDLGYDGEVKEHVDKILEELNKDKVSTQPFYFSDMLAYKSANTIEYTVIDEENPYYSITEVFNLASLTNKSINVYLNGVQLIFDKDYYFTDEGFLFIQAGQKYNDTIKVVEYESTDGSYIPPTPTKLGLYPRYEPEMLIDEQWLDNQSDAVNLQQAYKVYGENQTNHRQKGWFYPVYLDRKTAREADPEQAVATVKFKGLSKIFYAPANVLSTGTMIPNDNIPEYPVGHAFVKGHDGSMFKCYKDYRDNLILELEKRIYNNIKIDYSKTQINIHDYIEGKFRSTGLSKADIDRILLKDFAKWNKLANIDYTRNTAFQNQNQLSYNYSTASSVVDQVSLPGFWRAVYKQAFDTDRPNTHPWEMQGFTIKPLWWDDEYGPAPYTGNNLVLWQDIESGLIRYPTGVIIDEKYARPGLRNFLPVDDQGGLKPPINANYAKDVVLRNLDDSFEFGDEAPVESAWRRSSEYPFSLMKAFMLNRPADFLGKAFDVARVKRNLAGQYVYSETGKNIELDKIVFPNTYADNIRIPTSGIVNYVYNLIGSNVLTVYDDFKNEIKAIRNQMGFKLGGFTDKKKLNLLLQSKSPSTENAQGVFVPEENYQVFFNVSSPIGKVNYSGVIVEISTSGYIIQGYDTETPIFKYYSPIAKQGDPTIVAGGTSADVVEWNPNKLYTRGTILQNNFKYYRVTKDFTSGVAFSEDNVAELAELPITGGQRAQIKSGFDKNSVKELDYGSLLRTVQDVVDFLLGYGEYLKDQGMVFDYYDPEYEKTEDWKSSAREFLFWSSQGWASGTVIALSPSAYQIQLQRDYSVVDDVFDEFYQYSLVAENGRPLNRNFSSVLRDKNSFSLSLERTDNGIYNLVMPLVQKEHVVLLDNKTIFSDVIYQPYSGYRQERIQVLGYRSDNWDGSLNIPGFVYDDATITEWEPWQDYQIGSLVKHKEFYYVAIYQVFGSAEFNYNFWSRLNEKPESQLMTNFDFRANQFTDYYDVDSVGFDEEQQKLAQHLIGYQKRDYLANIINDDVSQFKFYQGFIQDKGTRNSIDKLFNGLEGTSESLEFYEEWAIQSGLYGDYDKTKQLGIQLLEDKLLETPQGIELVEYIPQNKFDTTFRVRPFDLVYKPEDYTVNAFPTTTLEEFLATGGYVHEDDIEYKIQSLLELETVDNNLLTAGEYIWITDISPNDWNVYRVVDSDITVTSFSLNEETNLFGQTTASITFTGTADFTEGSYVAINDAQLYNVIGFFEVESLSAGSLTLIIPAENDFKDFDNEQFACLTLKSARVPDFDTFNSIAQSFNLSQQKIWIDSYEGTNNWAVLENRKVYDITYEYINPNDLEDSTITANETQQFAKDITATFDNKIVFTSAPNNDDGEIFFYRRNQDSDPLVLSQSISNPGQNFDPAQSKFGESVAISEDGEYVAVGIPNASDILTKYQGTYSETADYAKNDIVKHKGSLWQARRQIFGKTTNRTYSTFDSFVDIDYRSPDDSTQIKLLITGSPGLVNQQVNHFLVRAPADQYLGSKVGDYLRLKWNEYTNLNGDLTTPVWPWNNTIPELGYDQATDTNFIDGFHKVTAKIDKILFLPEYTRAVSTGDTVQTDSGFARVAYVDIDAGNMVIYIENLRGTLDPAGVLEFFDFTTAVKEEVGQYIEIDYGFVEDFNGFWAVTLDPNETSLEFDENNTNYDNGSTFYDVGKGLVIVDVIQSQNYPADRFRNSYFNTVDSFKQIGAIPSDNLQPSMLHNLGDKWVARVGTEITDYILKDFLRPILGAGVVDNPSFDPEDAFANTTVDQYDKDYENDVTPGFDTDGIDKPLYNFFVYSYSDSPFYTDVANKGFLFSDLNKRQTIYDVWDGYIDVTLRETDVNNQLFRFQVGDTIEDVQRPFNVFGQPSKTPLLTNNVAVITHIVEDIDQRFDRQRLYIKIKGSGGFLLEDDVALVEINRIRRENGPGTNPVTRTIARIDNHANDVVVSNANVGKFIVVESSNLGVVSDFEVNGIEYYLSSENTQELGANSLPSIPSTLNRDYNQVFNIPTNPGGVSGPLEEGCVAIFQKSGPDNYILKTTIVSEVNFGIANNHFGKKVEIVKNGDIYRLYIASDGEGNTNNPGAIEFFEHGPIDTTTFKGTWNADLSYNIGDTVIFQGNYYVAKINVTNQTVDTIFDANSWNNISWRRSADINYKGVWNPSDEYSRESIVLYNGKQYISQTNLAAGVIGNPETATTNWTLLDNTVEYSGYIPNIDNVLSNEELDSTTNMLEFADDFAISNKGEILVTKVRQFQNIDTVKFLIYRQNLSGRYVLSQTIEFDDNTNGFGTSFDVSDNGNIIAISEPSNSEQGNLRGKVYLYRNQNGQFVEETEHLFAPTGQSISYFGYSLSFNSTSLNITCLEADGTKGGVLVYEELLNKLVFSERIDFDISDTDLDQTVYGINNHIYLAMPGKINSSYTGSIIEFRKSLVSNGWARIRQLIAPVDISKMRGIFLYNKRTEQKISYLDFIDPIQGKIAGPAEQNISYKVPYDPAQYNVGNTANDVNWAEEHVGKIWWNTENARFTYPYQGDINYQRANWNELQPGATIDVFEWVESYLLPSAWDSITNTAQGTSLGVTGTTLYGNERYSKTFEFDRQSQTFREKYYYWVKNKRTIPNIEGRTISALDIARLIAQPREQGYRYISFLANNRLVINNCKSLITGDDVVLNIDYITDEVKNSNGHNVYQIISDGLETSQIDANVELKWFDSLIGSDTNGKPVPDFNLPIKQRYGVQSIPRQGMFINRVEALKQFIERVNRVLAENLVVENYNISRLFEADSKPGIETGLFDFAVDSYSELFLVGTKVTTAELKPIVVNGQITRVEVTNRGRGYRVPPSYKINGTGLDANIKLTINNLGQVIDAKVLTPGANYDADTTITIRPFTALVEADETALNRWALYRFNAETQEWDREKIQGYDVARWWNYIDWYAEGYNNLTGVQYYIDQQYQLSSLNDRLGDIIKIANIGSGGWILLRKINNSLDNNYSIDYEVIGRQNGTIELSPSLYDSQGSSSSFDNRSYDNYFYDIDPRIELRIILDTIKNEIFGSDLRKEYNQLFISSLRYVLHEQKNPDWFFKTSFLKIKHLAGPLYQDLTYNADKLESYINYIEEVKPYSSVIREFVSEYTNLEETNTNVTDFDLPAYYNQTSQKIEPAKVILEDGIPVYDAAIINEYPRKSWLDHYGNSITEIVVTDGGSLYTYKPAVEVVGGYGQGAKAEAYIGGGTVTKVVVTQPGTGYVSVPEISIAPPPNSLGTTAKAVAVLGDNKVRSIDTKIKFDRITVNNLFDTDTLSQTESLTGTGANVEFNLKWPINLDRSTCIVSVDNIDLFVSQYTIENVKDISKSYTRYIGKITFENPPAKDAQITVNYSKNINMLNAADRIKYAYTPDVEMFGNDLSQLMQGVDYGGVEIKSFDFVTASGWDTDGWFNDVWDNAEVSDDEIITLDGSTSIIILNNPLEDYVDYNIYRVSYRINSAGAEEIYTNVRLDDPEYGTPQQTNLNAVCKTLRGDGSTQVIDINELGIRVNQQPDESKVTIVVRKTTSDGSIKPDPTVYDADIDGGRLDYANAKGIRAEEIIIDGDGFVTPYTAGGVEEIVPGQVQDTLDMQVTTVGEDSTTVVKYRLFKDILNRTVYKRIDTAPTVLAEDLGQDDLSIIVEDTADLPTPNRDKNLPGVVWIGKERIEYLVKEEGKLRQIRRGTLGTGVANVHVAGTEVYDQSAVKNIPYADVEQIQRASNVEEVTLNFVPENIFEFEVFVNGIRLNGRDIPKFDPTLDQDSPEGDITMPADYDLVFTGTTANPQYKIVITNPSLIELANKNIAIIRKQGTLWQTLGEGLADTQTNIGFFLRSGN